MLRLAVGIAAALSSPLAHAETTTRAPPEESAGSLRSKADEALISGRTDEALSLLGRAIGLEPLNERNLYKRARVYLRAKRIADAIGDLGAALKLAPEYEAALASRAKALASVGRCAEAGEDWKVARLVAKKDAAKRDADAGAAAAAACVKELADAAKARKRGDRRLELEHLNVVLENYADAQPAALLLDRARAHAANGDWYEAIAESGRALKAAPDDLEALELRGLAYYRLADHAMAKTHWQQALRSDPEHEGCKAGYKKLRALTKKDAAGDAARDAGDDAGAIAHWAAAAAVDASHDAFNVATHLKIARAHVKLKDYGAAEQACGAALRVAGDDVDALLVLAEAQTGGEQFDAAVRTATRAQELRDDDATRNARAKAEAALKQSKEVNFYKVLGVARDASSREIKKAYRDAALKYHPDKIAADASDADKEAMTNKFQEIATAYEVLSDDETRAKYDAGEDVTNPNAGNQQQQGGGFRFPHGFHGFPGGGGGGQRFEFRFG